MATSINGTVNAIPEKYSYYDFLFVDLADKRTNDWLMVKDPAPIFTIVGVWMYFVLKSGPRWMQDKKPFELKTVLIIYNFLQILVNTYIFFRGGQIAWFYKYNWQCEPVDFSTSDEALEIASLVHMYYITKIVDLLDTVFFVLRKKESQVTFLHMYHHTVMALIAWGCTKYYPGGHGTFVGFLNSFVHIIMYSYYTLAAMGPNIQKYLWWKKYITSLQLVQFCLVFIHNSQLFFIDCGFPRWTALMTVPNAIFFYQLFNQFYNQAYRAPKKQDSDKTENNIVENINGNASEIVKNGKIE